MHAADFLRTPPGGLVEFTITPEEVEARDDLMAVCYRLACRGCSGERFTLFEMQTSDYGAVGIDATCTECGAAGAVFCGARDGYDGRLGHSHFLEQVPARRSDVALASHVLVACEANYSIDPQELAAIASEEGVPLQDLFDWFLVWIREDADQSWRCVWEYECA